MESNSRKSKYRFSSLYIGITVVVLGAVVFLAHSQKKQAVQQEVQKQAAIEQQKPVTITFVGDIMFDRGVNRSIQQNFAGDFDALYTNASYLKDTDITFGNLEGSVGTTGRKVGSRFSFHMNPAGLVAMKNAGFDVVSFANNHVGDYAQQGFEESLAHLDENNILYAGAGKTKTDALTPRIITVRGMKIGFLGSTDVGPTWMKAGEDRAGIITSDDPALMTAIKEADSQVDVLVVSFHFGNEYSPANKHQEQLAHMAIDNGADIVVGHHPHVMEKIETYKEKPIFFSLGNFIFDQYFSPNTLQGMVAKVSIDPNTKATSYNAFVSKMSKQFIPQPLLPFEDSVLITKTFFAD